MSWNPPGWIPGAPHQDDVPVCGRCGHHADAHRDFAQAMMWRLSVADLTVP
jgi:hypothetical protein